MQRVDRGAHPLRACERRWRDVRLRRVHDATAAPPSVVPPEIADGAVTVGDRDEHAPVSAELIRNVPKRR
jgi:hypothetical protein